MMDIEFPSNSDKNWGIAPTTVPEMSGELIKQVAEQIYEAQKRIPTEAEIHEAIFKIADNRAKAMSKEIEDQLEEFDYRRVIRNVVHSGHVFGTGVMKGPFIREVTSKRWIQDPRTKEWTRIEIKRVIPTAQWVSVWDIYPDMSATELDQVRYLWQKHLMTKNQFTALGKRSDFNGKAVDSFIDAYPSGNAEYKQYEDYFRDMSSNSSVDGDNTPPKREKYEVHERWGFLSIEDAEKLVPDVPEETWEKFGPEVACNIWLVDNVIIKAVLSPIEGADIPYYMYYFDKDETSIFGDGIPRIMRDPQVLFNASVRAMLDNAAISAGPIIESNVDLLADGEDPLSMYPFRVFQRKGVGIEASQQAVRVTKLPSYTNEFLGLVNFFQETADESTTVPRYLHGQQQMTQSQRTATGLSMLIGASNITLKDQVQYFDEGVTTPFIKSMYFWNMEFSNKESIKGDFNVEARGSKSLVAKEVKMEQINNFLSLTNNPTDLRYIKRDVLLRQLAEIFDLDNLGFIKSKEEVAADDKRNAEAAKRQQDMDMLLEAMKAESSGHVPNAVQKIAQMFNIQLPGGAPPSDQPNQLQGSLQGTGQPPGGQM
jgi:hypothetical protein